jgi:hypothetical protein
MKNRTEIAILFKTKIEKAYELEHQNEQCF